MRSILELQLFTVQDMLGAMNFHTAPTNRFDRRVRAVDGVLAAHAAVAMSAANDHGTVQQMKAAREGSRTISTAVGSLMIQTNNSRDGALHLLM